ncbi:hypothetical protein QJQ45_014308 [Haematococcus lacustris]|nr:hypothetical protein QJQ45_014308 [Haematococcus lacustris]
MDGTLPRPSDEATEDALPQAMDILASLERSKPLQLCWRTQASLGINPQLRQRVQEALVQLQAASSGAAQALVSPQPGTTDHSPAARDKAGARAKTGTKAGAGATTGRAADAALSRRVDELEQKLAMSRSIMRKLYHKCVNLEKEAQQVSAANQVPANFTHTTAELLAMQQTELLPPLAAASPAQSPVAQALMERDSTIQQLHQALEATRRRCSLLEQRKYKQIRDDYHRLLFKRASSIQSSKAVPSAAKVVVDNIQTRLHQEVAEREAEAALYSARLYESERQLSDWYVEKRMLEQHIARLREEVAQRDRLDQEIESCVCGLFERMRQLELANEQLRSQLAAEGEGGWARQEEGVGS